MRVRVMAATAATAALAGCTPLAMAGFDDPAPGTERLAMSGVPSFMNGNFRLGASRGHVARRSTTETRESRIGPAAWVPGQIAQQGRGRLTFDLSGPEVGGRLEGECRYDRIDAGYRLGNTQVSANVRPLLLACTYRADGRNAGVMELRAPPPGTPTPLEERAGEVRVDGAVLAVRSEHAMADITGPSPTPVGYSLRDEAGRPVGALETVGGSTRRLMVPTDPARRRAALAALVTLGLFWDPDGEP